MFIHSIKKPLEKYLNVTSSCPSINRFAKNLTKQIYPTITSLAKIGENDLTVITKEISKAPDDLKAVFKQLWKKRPTSYSELIEIVENIKNICMKNPKAKEYMINFQEFLNTNKHAHSLVKKVSKGTYNFVNVFLKVSNKNKRYVGERAKYLETAQDLFNNITQTNIFTHINEMFKYITK